jgi:hypothetical protein
MKYRIVCCSLVLDCLCLCSISGTNEYLSNIHGEINCLALVHEGIDINKVASLRLDCLRYCNMRGYTGNAICFVV